MEPLTTLLLVAAAASAPTPSPYSPRQVWLVSSNLLTGASSDLSNTPHGREAEAAADLQRLAVSGQNISWWLPSAEPQGGPDRDSAEDGDSAEDLSTSDSLTGRLLFWEPRRGRPTAAYHGHGAESAGTWQSGRFGKKLAGRPGGGLRTSLSGLDGTLVGPSAPAGKLAGAAEKLGAPANRWDGATGRVDGSAEKLFGPTETSVDTLDGSFATFDSPAEELAGVARELGVAGQPGGAAGQLGGPDRQLGHFSATVTSDITFEQLGGVAGKLRGLGTAGESNGQIGTIGGTGEQMGGSPGAFSGIGEQLGGPADHSGRPAAQFGGPADQFGGPAGQLGRLTEQEGDPPGQLDGPADQSDDPCCLLQFEELTEQLGGPSEQFEIADGQFALDPAGKSSDLAGLIDVPAGNSESGTGQLGGLPVGPAVQLEGLTGHLGGPGNQIVPTGLTLEGGFGGETDLGGFDELNGLGDVDATVDVELSTTKEVGKPLTKQEHITTSKLLSVDSLAKAEKSVKQDEPIAVDQSLKIGLATDFDGIVDGIEATGPTGLVERLAQGEIGLSDGEYLLNKAATETPALSYGPTREEETVEVIQLPLEVDESLAFAEPGEIVDIDSPVEIANWGVDDSAEGDKLKATEVQLAVPVKKPAKVEKVPPSAGPAAAPPTARPAALSPVLPAVQVAFLPRAALRHLLPYGVGGRLLRVIYVPGLAGLTGGHSVQLGYLVHGERRQPVPLVPLQFPERRW